MFCTAGEYHEDCSTATCSSKACSHNKPAAVSSFNTGYYGETDLGANLINFHRYTKEQLSFGDLPANNAQASRRRCAPLPPATWPNEAHRRRLNLVFQPLTLALSLSDVSSVLTRMGT